jgi:hypothetical protein
VNGSELEDRDLWHGRGKDGLEQRLPNYGACPNFARHMGARWKAKQSHNTPMEARGERRYSSYSFATSALDGVSGQPHAPAALYLSGKDPDTHWTGMLDGPLSRSGHTGYRKNLCLYRGLNPDRSVIQSVARHYTDWATPAPYGHKIKYIFRKARFLVPVLAPNYKQHIL